MSKTFSSGKPRGSLHLFFFVAFVAVAVSGTDEDKPIKSPHYPYQIQQKVDRVKAHVANKLKETHIKAPNKTGNRNIFTDIRNFFCSTCSSEYKEFKWCENNCICPVEKTICRPPLCNKLDVSGIGCPAPPVCHPSCRLVIIKPGQENFGRTTTTSQPKADKTTTNHPYDDRTTTNHPRDDKTTTNHPKDDKTTTSKYGVFEMNPVNSPHSTTGKPSSTTKHPDSNQNATIVPPKAPIVSKDGSLEGMFNEIIRETFGSEAYKVMESLEKAFSTIDDPQIIQDINDINSYNRVMKMVDISSLEGCKPPTSASRSGLKSRTIAVRGPTNIEISGVKAVIAADWANTFTGDKSKDCQCSDEDCFKHTLDVTKCEVYCGGYLPYCDSYRCVCSNANIIPEAHDKKA